MRDTSTKVRNDMHAAMKLHRFVSFVVVAVVITSCKAFETKQERCQDFCMGRGIESFSNEKGCKCYSYDQRVYRSNNDIYCETCKGRCAPNAMKVCKFGNDTWGAGPNVCECYSSPPPAESR